MKTFVAGTSSVMPSSIKNKVHNNEVTVLYGSFIFIAAFIWDVQNQQNMQDLQFTLC